MNKTKIIVAGIGGVGGYFGGLLAKRFQNSDDVEVNFIARGQHLLDIQQNGLIVVKGTDSIVAKPTCVTDNPSEAGIASFLIICTKTYDLQNILGQLKPCIDKDTIILPLLNGVNNKEIIKQEFPDNLVLDGCVYIVSRLTRPGVVENTGNIQSLYFGTDTDEDKKLILLESLLKEASIDASYSKNISKVIWEKFIFLSPLATATSYFDKNVGELRADEEYSNTLTALNKEVIAVATAKQVPIADDILETTQKKQSALPFGTMTSMHIDFQTNKPHNELESLAGVVINEGGNYGVGTPVYQRMYERLKGKTKVS